MVLSFPLTVELDREAPPDNRYICTVAQMHGVMAYGNTPGEALNKVMLLAERVIGGEAALRPARPRAKEHS